MRKTQILTLFLGSLMMLGGVTGCGNDTASSSSLAMFRGDLQHTGSYTAKGPDQLRGVKWKFATKGPVRSSPVTFEHTVYFGSDDGHVYAVDADTGTQKWSFETKGPVKSAPAIAGRTAYFLSGDGNFYAVDAGSGKLAWSLAIPGKDEPRDRVDYWQSSPAVSDGVVYFGGGDSTLYAVDAVKGTVVWQQKLTFNNYPNPSVMPVLHSSPAVRNGIVYMGMSGMDLPAQFEPGGVVALDAKSGKIKWTSPLLSAVDSSVTLDEHAVYLGTRGGDFYALDIETGQKKWSSDKLPYVLASPAVKDGVIYSGSSDTQILASLAAQTGSMNWTFKTVGPIHASPATDGQTVFVACGNHYTDDNNGIVYAVDAQTGKEKWSYQTGGNIYSSPALDNGVLYIGSDDGSLYALN